VFVIITGPPQEARLLDHVVPVISPLPFSVNQPAKTGRPSSCRAAARRFHARADGSPPHDQLAAPGDDGRLADLDARDVGDGVERARRAVERDSHVTGSFLF